MLRSFYLNVSTIPAVKNAELKPDYLFAIFGICELQYFRRLYVYYC
jgi:hypothetical protein